MEKQMQLLWCTSFIEFEKIATRNNWIEKVPNDIAIISINNGKDVYTDKNEKHICNGDNVLNLDFDDIDTMAFNLPEDTETYKYITNNGKEITIEFFTEEQAKKAVNFIEKYKNKNFYIHCSAGISRSQAFVQFIEYVLNEQEWKKNPDNPCLFPNIFVYNKLMKAWRELNDISF